MKTTAVVKSSIQSVVHRIRNGKDTKGSFARFRQLCVAATIGVGTTIAFVPSQKTKLDATKGKEITFDLYTDNSFEDNTVHNKTDSLLAESRNDSSKPQALLLATDNKAPLLRTNTHTIIDYDFVIVGHGNAGQSALKALRKSCPSAKIGVVDPLRVFSSYSERLVDFWPHTAVAFNPSRRCIQLSSGQSLRYKHNILIATGSRGAPPPRSLLDPAALDRVLELRPTENTNAAMESSKQPGDEDKKRIKTPRRPVLPPRVVRHLAFMASSQGATVGVLGSGWEAVELAVAAARAGSPSVLMFGGAGPLSHVLPRYLSSAVTRRLEKENLVRVLERSLVRYVANDVTATSIPRLELHTAKSYDLMDTQRTSADLLVVAPHISGARGTAVLPTTAAQNDDDCSSNGDNNQPWYQTWSQLTLGDSSNIVCYADDGRLVVNAEMCAASHVYAAGSVAKYPNSVTGHAHVAGGEGSVHGGLAGEVAAQHMSREYHERLRTDNHSIHENNVVSFAAESFPIWRSDTCSYLSEEEGSETSALSSVGIRALCVGQCDSDRMATHGFWWTNQAVHRRLTRRRSREATSNTHSRALRQRQTSLRGSKSVPIYGTGVVFYLDRTGKICGIMTWGLPYAVKSKQGLKELNKDLVNRMKEVIRSNGRAIVNSSDHVLQSFHLADETRNIATIAQSTALFKEKCLYRYTPAKPPSITSVGMLKRKHQTGSGELLGENLYVRNELGYEALTRPQTLVYVYPMGDNGRESLVNKANLAFNVEQIERLWHDNELRARPPKEEPLWLRRGDTHKMINLKQAVGELAEANIKAGKFADGTDAVQQAKVPQVIQKTKQTLQEWIYSKKEEDDHEEDGFDSNNE